MSVRKIRQSITKIDTCIIDGTNDGDDVGMLGGSEVGLVDGLNGFIDGTDDGDELGLLNGSEVGLGDGLNGFIDGTCNGHEVGLLDGSEVNSDVI